MLLRPILTPLSALVPDFMQYMAASTLSVILIFAFTVSGVTEGCDVTVAQCCCPTGQVTVLQTGSAVVFTFKADSGSDCASAGNTAAQCQLSGSNCESSAAFSFTATKSGGAVAIRPSRSVCNIDLSCTLSTCENSTIWTGTYSVSGSNGAVVPVACLLIVTLLGLLV